MHVCLSARNQGLNPAILDAPCNIVAYPAQQSVVVQLVVLTIDVPVHGSSTTYVRADVFIYSLFVFCGHISQRKAIILIERDQAKFDESRLTAGGSAESAAHIAM